MPTPSILQRRRRALLLMAAASLFLGPLPGCPLLMQERFDNRIGRPIPPDALPAAVRARFARQHPGANLTQAEEWSEAGRGVLNYQLFFTPPASTQPQSVVVDTGGYERPGIRPPGLRQDTVPAASPAPTTPP